MRRVTLRNGIEIPIVGLGTWKSKKEEAYNAVKWALETGYRHIDSAAVYGNEVEVGKAIKDSNVDRKEIFLTSKLWNTEQGYESTKKAIEKSLRDLDVEYIDLYLIHWFKGYELGISSWKAIEEAYLEGKLKAIGVSNHSVHHLMNLIDNSNIAPMVNQVETHIELQNEFLRKYCEDNGIALEAYAPLMSWKVQELLNNETLKIIADRHNKTVPQIAINWLNSRGIIALPKSTNKTRIESNFEVFDFELTDSELEEIKKLNKGNKLFPEFDNVMF